MTKNTKVKNVESVEKALTIKDRFALIGILPKQNDIITMVMIRDIEIRMAMTQPEKAKHNFRKVKGKDGGWTWDHADLRTTFTFSNAEMELIRIQITELDKQKKISADMLDFCLLMRE